MTITSAREAGRFCLALITTLMLWSVAMEIGSGRESCSTGVAAATAIAVGVGSGTVEW